MGDSLSSKSVGGRTNVRIVLSALEVMRLVPSGVLLKVRISHEVDKVNYTIVHP